MKVKLKKELMKIKAKHEFALVYCGITLLVVVFWSAVIMFVSMIGGKA